MRYFLLLILGLLAVVAHSDDRPNFFKKEEKRPIIQNINVDWKWMSKDYMFTITFNY